MKTNSCDIPEILGSVERAQVVVARYSENNGVILLVWGVTFLLDMVAFDVSRPLKSVYPGVIFMFCLNPAVLGWRFWYVQRLPVRPLRSITNKIIFLWSFYYVTLTLLGLVGWALLIGVYPPYWFSFLGVLGALPLLGYGWRLWRRAHRVETI